MREIAGQLTLCQPKSGTASLTVPMRAFMAQGDVLMIPYTCDDKRAIFQQDSGFASGE